MPVGKAAHVGDANFIVNAFKHDHRDKPVGDFLLRKIGARGDIAALPVILRDKTDRLLDLGEGQLAGARRDQFQKPFIVESLVAHDAIADHGKQRGRHVGRGIGHGRRRRKRLKGNFVKGRRRIRLEVGRPFKVAQDFPRGRRRLRKGGKGNGKGTGDGDHRTRPQHRAQSHDAHRRAGCFPGAVRLSRRVKSTHVHPLNSSGPEFIWP